MNVATRHTVRTGLIADLLADAVPGWTELRDSAERLRAETSARQSEAPTALEIHRENNEALVNAKNSAEIQAALDKIRENAAQRERNEADGAALMAVRNSIGDSLNRIERESVHEVTAVIRDRVEAISEEIQAMKARPLSAQEAIDQDAATEWKRLGKLAADWSALVQAYTTIARTEVEGPGLTVLSHAAFISNPLELHPFFAERRRKAGSVNAPTRKDSFHEKMNAWSEAAPAPRFDTMEPRGGGGKPANADPVSWVVYLTDNDAMTVHDPSHATDQWMKAMEATAPITANNAEQRAHARAEYARLSGDDDLTTVADLEPAFKAAYSRSGRRKGVVFA